MDPSQGPHFVTSSLHGVHGSYPFKQSNVLFFLFLYIFFFQRKKKGFHFNFYYQKEKKSLLLFPSWIRRKGFGRLFTISLYAMNNLVQSVPPKKDCTKFNMTKFNVTIHNWRKNHLDSEINCYT